MRCWGCSLGVVVVIGELLSASCGSAHETVAVETTPLPDPLGPVVPVDPDAPRAPVAEPRVRRRGDPTRRFGYLSPEQINAVVRAGQDTIRHCYEVEVQRRPQLRGRVAIQWRIDLQGAVSSAQVAETTLANAAVERCMLAAIRQWRFPAPIAGEVVVTYPFLFGVQS